MNRFIRNMVVGVSSAAIVFSSFVPAFADKPFLIYEDKSSENISSGVVHETIRQFNAQGWWNINVLRIDMDDEYTEVKALFSQNGISKKEKLTDMMKNSNAIAGINGDFFTSQYSSFPLGAVISNGRMVTSPIDPNNKLPVFAIDQSKNPFIAFWDWQIRAISENGEPVTLSAINKDSKLHEEVIMYDSNWNALSMGNKVFTDLIEIVVIDDIVTEVRVGQEPINLPQNGYILTGRGRVRDRLLNNFHVGDRVNMEINTTPNYQNIVTAIGGGSPLLKDGAITDFKINITGNHPRTALGITRDKKQLIMVTIDGRDSSYKGVSQQTMAEIMSSLGAYDAINFDGGGSTTMAIKPAGSEKPAIVNKPSDGGERKVINGLGVYSNAPEGSLSYIQVYTDDTKMFANTTRSFYIKGFDQYHNPINVDINDVDFSIDGIKGTFNDNTLTAYDTGNGVVKASYKGHTAELNINVFGDIKELQIDIDKFGIDVSSQKDLGKIYGKNKEGYVAKIEPSDISWEAVGNVGTVQDGIFYSSDKPTAGALTARIGNAVENILVSVGFKEIMINDFEKLDNIRFTSYPQTVAGKLELDKEEKEGNFSAKLSYDFTQSDDTRAAYIVFGENGMPLEGTPDKIGMWVYGNESNSWLRGEMSDSAGKTYKLDFASHIDWKGWKWITANIPTGVSYPINLGRIYVTETNPLNKMSGELLFDGLKALYPNSIDSMMLPTPTEVVDEKQKTVEKTQNGYNFMVSFGIDNLDNLYKHRVANTIKEHLSKNSLGFFMGKTSDKVTSNTGTNSIQVVNGYYPIRQKDVLFLKVDDSNGGIRASNADQWLWLKHDLENSTQENIILFLPKPIFGSNGFTDKLEANLLHDTLAEYKQKGKNIWVVYGGNKNEVDLRDGIRYIEVGKPNLNVTESSLDLEYIEFTVNDGDITYDFKSVFEPVTR